VTENIPQIW